MTKLLAKGGRVDCGYLYLTDGRLEKVRPSNGKRFSLRELQQAVEGYCEQIIPNPNLGFAKMLANEEAGMPMNAKMYVPNPHTSAVLNMYEYVKSGYSPDWQILGNIFGIKREAPDHTLPTIKTVMHKEKQ